MTKISTRANMIKRVNAGTAGHPPGKPRDPHMLDHRSDDQDLKELKKKIQQGATQLANAGIYSIKDASGGKVIKMFEPHDQRQVGITNVANGKLEKDRTLLVGSIQLLAYVHDIANNGAVTPAIMAAANFGSIKTIPNLPSGQITVNIRTKNKIEKLSLLSFVRDNDRNQLIGELILESPILIKPQEPIAITIETGADLAAGTLLKIVLNGTGSVTV